MDPKHYLSLLRRRWWAIALAVVLGLTLGWVTTPSSAGPDEPDYYRATHTLVAETGTSAPPNLAQLSLLLRVGDVPERVAAEFGVEPDVLVSQVQVRQNPQVATLDITSVGTDPDRAVRIADGFAGALLATLTETTQQERAEAQTRLSARLDELEARLADLDAQIEDGAGDLVQAQRDALVREYGIVYEDFQVLSREPEATVGLRTLQPAVAVPISGDAFVAALQETLGATDPSEPTAIEDGDPDEEDPLLEAFDAGPSEPPSPARRGMLGGGLGLVLSVGAVVLFDRFDDRLRTKEDAEEAFGLPVVAEIPLLRRRQRRNSEVVSAERPRSRIAEAYRGLRTSVQYMGVVTSRVGESPSDLRRQQTKRRDRSDGTVVLVTSPGPAEGKSTTVVNLAAAYAESGSRVLIVDGDFRRPAVHEFLPEADVGRGNGLAPVDAPDVSGLIGRSHIPGVSAITHLDERLESVQPADLLSWIRSTVQQARPTSDVVLIDTAPFLTVNDARDLLDVADQVVVVARSGKTSRQSADRMSELLARLSAKVVGVVLVGSGDTPATKRYYYSKDPTSEPLPPPTDGQEQRGIESDELDALDAEGELPEVHPADR